uniref:MORN repeat-containing protein 5 n=1 Tax=Grammatophora oceanica TaxID=210454 RepID=A0A7S1VVS5_9STRA|mmetsp:Transcript_9227/g.13465  ORF Transcript_9227/g.13465 Transcript_9227/m.13465 type:complete len:426 (+) Transcript_9227:259-1536(+)|eukprot:CAMPEP_0194048268 /NCGR_PEP_ID=MMETSP0009_2-20130614/26822_1 /TAXON_ID=210454 /ORGANISM="Grammatophora oceanica, Strain CCMP 410" /LENGTH=425 /DNA_ID=CAMNT_0038694095 /DNA_START=259 /DNA_END=1536 /DNA_ORIENTATION=+
MTPSTDFFAAAAATSPTMAHLPPQPPPPSEAAVAASFDASHASIVTDDVATPTDLGAVLESAPPTTTTSDLDPDVEDLVATLREQRVSEGACPHCGTQLYVMKRRGWKLQKHRKPLSVAGRVLRGQCLQCMDTDTAAANNAQAAAIALASIPEPEPEPTPSRNNTNNIEGVDPTTATIAATVTATPQLNSITSPHSMDAIYRGPFNSYGERQGQGELIWSNGDRYVGEFWNGVREGEGTLYFVDGSEYVGSWANNKMHGAGCRRFPNGNVYNGNYQEGKRCGHGRCYYANGDMYVGAWRQDKLDGFGRYYYNNGQCFEGTFSKGKRMGRGKYQLTDGRVDIYCYLEDERVGEGVRWSANRKKAWRLVNGKVKGRIGLQTAADIAQSCEQEVVPMAQVEGTSNSNTVDIAQSHEYNVGAAAAVGGI